MSVKNRLRDAAAQLLFLSRITDAKWRGRGRLSIVTFHRVLPEAERRKYPYPGLAVTPEELSSLLAYLKKHFDCGPLSIQHEKHVRGERTARPLLAVTFDDGQYDNYLYARPLLDRHGIKASFFVPVSAVESGELLWHDQLGFAILALLHGKSSGKERLTEMLGDAGLSGTGPGSMIQNAVQQAKGLALNARLRLIETLTKASCQAAEPEFARLMTFKELADLAADGHEIGSHSMTHCMMPECDNRALTYEVEESRRVLESRLSRAIESFCYPNGNFDARTSEAVRRAGYRRAATTLWGSNERDADPFQLRRCDMDANRVRSAYGEIMPALVAFRMSGFYPGLS